MVLERLKSFNEFGCSRAMVSTATVLVTLSQESWIQSSISCGAKVSEHKILYSLVKNFLNTPTLNATDPGHFVYETTLFRN